MASHCFGKCDFEGKTLPISLMITGLSGNLEIPQIVHESYNDVTRLLAKLGPAEGLALLGEPVCVGAFGWGGGHRLVTVKGR